MKNVLILLLLTGFLGFSQTRRQPDKRPQLIVYGIDDCHYCHDTKLLLDENKVDYVFYNVDINVAKRLEMVAHLKAAQIDLKNLNMPVIKTPEKLLINDGNFEKFLQQLLKLTVPYASKN